MTIAKLTEILSALTTAGAVDENAEVVTAVSDSEGNVEEKIYSILSITINSTGDVILDGWDG